MEIKNIYDLKEYYRQVEEVGGRELSGNMDEIRKYVSLVKEFASQAFEFLIGEGDFIIIEGENGVLGFSPEGREIYREFPKKIRWKEEFVGVCLKYLRIG